MTVTDAVTTNPSIFDDGYLDDLDRQAQRLIEDRDQIRRAWRVTRRTAKILTLGVVTSSAAYLGIEMLAR